MTQPPACPSCGTALPSDALVCPNCGTATALAATAHMAAHDTPTLHYKGEGAKVNAEAVQSQSGILTQARMLDALRAATVGDYEVLAELGRGGMATVYLAHDVQLDRKVAIKVMSPALLDGEGAIERFKREARTAGALSHPHIIPIHAVRQSGDLLYFVMKYVEGRPLDNVVRDEGALSTQMVIQILSEVAGALAHAHRRGVVHRDVKPANIMLDDDGWAVVTDFGIAKVALKQSLTMTGATVGTPAYMSPEQCIAKEVTGLSDQYSLGIVGYELLTGRVPFTADSLMGMFMAQMNDAPTALLELRPDCPPELAAIVNRMMAKAPAERWPSLDDVVAALTKLLKPEGRASTRTSMMALARVSDGVPRPDDFTRPLSPTPLSALVKPQTVAPSDAGALLTAKRSRAVPTWAVALLAAVPVVVAAVFIVMKLNGRAVKDPAAPANPNVTSRVQSPPVTAGLGAATGSQSVASPANTKAGQRDSSAIPSANKQGAKSNPSPADKSAGIVSNPSATLAAAPSTQPPKDTARAQTKPADVVVPPAGNARADSAAAALAAAPAFSEISAGGSTTCGALVNDGGVLCWGAASQSGAMLQGVLFSKLSAGDGHICGLTSAGEAYCWGTNSQGQLGDGTTTERDKPTAVKATQRFVEISVGAGHTCALSADGTAFCWGGNKYGQLGDGSRSSRNKPVLVRSTAGNQGFQSLAAGGSHTCGITRANKAFCWGDGFSGQVGNAMQDYAAEPFAVKTDLAFRSVVAGDRHTCGLTTSGRVYCWGSNTQGQLGNETKDDRNVPDSVATDQVFRTIGAGGMHTCGISNRRQLLCWGNNSDGRLGDGTRSSRTVPVIAAGGQAFSLVSAGSGHTCALTATGQALCWGGNARGQLGGGSASPFSASPVLVKVKGS